MIAASLAAVVTLSPMAFAQQAKFGTPAEARAMFDKAIAAIKADKAKALDMFNKEREDSEIAVSTFSASMTSRAYSTHSWSRASSVRT